MTELTASTLTGMVDARGAVEAAFELAEQRGITEITRLEITVEVEAYGGRQKQWRVTVEGRGE